MDFVDAQSNLRRFMKPACCQVGITLEPLSLVVQHQANQRIIEAIPQKLKFPATKIFSKIRYLGNISSSSIQLGLESLLQPQLRREYLGREEQLFALPT